METIYRAIKMYEDCLLSAQECRSKLLKELVQKDKFGTLMLLAQLEADHE